jgi:hypothetical protein
MDAHVIVVREMQRNCSLQVFQLLAECVGYSHSKAASPLLCSSAAARPCVAPRYFGATLEELKDWAARWAKEFPDCNFGIEVDQTGSPHDRFLLSKPHSPVLLVKIGDCFAFVDDALNKLTP